MKIVLNSSSRKLTRSKRVENKIGQGQIIPMYSNNSTTMYQHIVIFENYNFKYTIVYIVILISHALLPI